MPTATASNPAAISLDQLADATPDSRDRYIDFLRGLAIIAVAIGHWLVVVPSYHDGTFDGINALEAVPLMHWLSWIFQVMPLFFIVGGYANAVSWRSARRRSDDWSTWVRGRFQRLLRPTVVFIGAWVALGVVLRSAGVDAGLVHTLSWLVVVPLWFLAVYVVTVALAPTMLWLHDHVGLVVPVILVVAAAFVDDLRIRGGMETLAYVNFLFVFLFCQQLGFFWRDGRLDARRWQPWAMFLGGLGTLFLLTHVGPYPLSMVGVPGEKIANNAPPTITFVALGFAQAGLALLVREPINRWLHRRKPWSAVIGINAHALTIHVWHFTALVIVSVVILPLGILPTYEYGTGAWWLLRWLAVPVLTVPLVALVMLFGRFERPKVAAARPLDPAEVQAVSVTSSSASPSSGVAVLDDIAALRATTATRRNDLVAIAGTVVATLSLMIAFVLITLHGLSRPDAPLGIPYLALTLLALGTVISTRRPQKANWRR